LTATRRFPPTRLFTIDTCSIAKDKHHIGALLELDVTEGRRRLRRWVLRQVIR
jgi:hypothetical protein